VPVTVVYVRMVRMRMNQRPVLVFMHVRLLAVPCERMLVLVMLVVRVRVRVQERLVPMPVLVSLADVNPHTEPQ
jgi:hypothetical protein